MQIVKFRILCLLFISGCSHVDEETSRSFVSRVVADTQTERNEIASELLAGHKSIRLAGPLLLKERDSIKPANIDFGWITTTGVVVAQSNSPGVVLILEPSVSDNLVKWTCTVHPPSAKPNVCLNP